MLEYLAKAFPDLRPVVAANPALPAVLRDRILQMGVGDLSQVSPASPVSAETAPLPSITTADYSVSPHAASPYTGAPGRATAYTGPHTAVLKTSPVMPTQATAPAPAQTSSVELSEPQSASRYGSRTGLIAAAGASAEQAAQPAADAAEAEAAPPPSGGPSLAPSAKTYSYQYVDTPSKNISCILNDEGVGCSILERSYTSSGMQDCPDREFSIVALAGRTEVRCGEEYLGQPGDTFHTLQYGETTTFSDYACTSQSKGMTCWNTITGRGFTISRESHVRF